MARYDDFNDRQTQIDAENEPYNHYEYQEDDNGALAGALPVKQYVGHLHVILTKLTVYSEDCMIQV